MEPIRSVMDNGIRLLCGDGHERLCFPVLCQYIGDMEEQWTLTCLIRPSCPKCPKRYYSIFKLTETASSGDNLETNWSHDPDDEVLIRALKRRRTDADVTRLREAVRNGTMNHLALHELGFHPDSPFSDQYPWNGILDSVGPDLLHQVSKCFLDDVFHKWLYPLVINVYKEKGFSEAMIESELDCRFTLIPPFKELRRFSRGILAQDHHWTVDEIKDMTKIMVGALYGICPAEGIALLREYLHIHRLSHYLVHTEDSLQWLESACETFNDLLRAPAGPFIKYGLLESVDYEPQKIHYLRHYPQCVRQKGTLTSYSTDRTEIHHKPFKASYARSNKRGDDYLKFILKDYAVISSFQKMIDGFDPEKEATGEDTPARDRGYGSNKESNKELESDDSDYEESNDWSQTGGTLEPGVENSCSSGDFVLQRRIYVWKLKRRKGWPRSTSETEEILCLPGLLTSLRRYMNSEDGTLSADDLSEFNPYISVYDSIRMEWPSWREDNIAINQSGERIGDNLETARRQRHPVEYTHPSNRTMMKASIKAIHDGYCRNDPVLVSCPNRRSRGIVNTMTGRRVAQVLLLFKCQRQMVRSASKDRGEMELAYVHWFSNIQSPEPFRGAGLYLVSRTKTCGVIPVHAIERPVHLIPKFGNEMGATIPIYREIQRNLDTFKWFQADKSIAKNMQPSASAPQARFDKPLDSLAYYSEFYLNSWSDRHVYESIY